MSTNNGNTKYTISQAARLLDRSPHTLRSWDRNSSMPAHLRPPRDHLKHRYWTPELIEQIRDWIAANDFHPGSGIAYHPSAAQLAKHIGKIRRAAAERGQGHAEPLRDLIEDAIDNLGIDPDDVVKMIPDVIRKINERDGVDIHLDDALRTASEVLAARAS